MTISEFKRLVIVSVLGCALVACGGGRIVESKDDSVDYRSAKSLPPLKKPELILNPRTQPTAATSLPEPSQSSDDLQALGTKDSSAQVAEAPMTVAPLEAAPLEAAPLEAAPLEAAPQTQEFVAEEEAYIDNSRVETIEQSSSSLALNVSVVNDGNMSELEVLADVEQAWEFVAESMQRSSITVFNRNRSGLKFAIGCGDIPEQAAVVKKGGWSIFSREKSSQSAYCSLALEERKGKTYASVLNRLGQKVVSEYSVPIYNRLLNN